MRKRVDISKYKDLMEEGLLAFYKDLGWNPETHDLNVKKVSVSQATWNNLLNILFPEQTTQQGLFYMNYGPSVSNNLKDMQVATEKGWIE